MDFFQKTYNVTKAIVKLEDWYKQQQEVLANAWTSVKQFWVAFLESLDNCWDAFSGFFQQIDAILKKALEYFNTSAEEKSMFEKVSEFFNDFVQKVFNRDASAARAAPQAAAVDPEVDEAAPAARPNTAQQPFDAAAIFAEELFPEQQRQEPAANAQPPRQSARRRR